MILTINIFIFICIAFYARKNLHCPLIKIRYINVDSYIDNLSWFCAFSLFTAPIFLSPIKEWKYVLWFMLVIWLVYSKQYNVNAFSHIKTYFPFVVYACFGVFLGEYWMRGGLTIIKYLLLSFYFIIGYSVPSPQLNYKKIFAYAELGTILALITASGMSARYIAPLYLFFINFFFTYGGISDFFSAISPICLGLFFSDKRYKHLIVYALCLLSSVYFVVRTGIGSFFVGLILFSVYRYKKQSPYIIAVVLCVFFSIIFFVPKVRNKMFTDDVISNNDNIKINTLFDSSNLRDNGRENVTSKALFYFQGRNKMLGAGTGALNTLLRRLSAERLTPAIAHNDYLVIYIDHGIIGCVLGGIFILSLLIDVMYSISCKAESKETKLLGQVAIASLGSCLFAMRFENIIAHVMSSIGISFILLGMFYRSLDDESKQPQRKIS